VEFLWLFAYNLKFPVTIAAGVGLLLSTVMFLQGLAANNRSAAKSGDPRVAWGVFSGLVFGLLWMGIYAVPSPTYNVKYVDRPVTIEKKVLVKVYAGTRVVEPTWDQRLKYCIDTIGSNLDRCEKFANDSKKPLVVKKVVRTITNYVDTPFEQNVKWCNDKTQKTLDDCTIWAKDMMNAHPKVVTKTITKEVPVFKGERIIVKKDTFYELFKKCGDEYSLDRAPPAQFGALRNERMKICKDVALAGSR
jgi:hypothetical protein